MNRAMKLFTLLLSAILFTCKNPIKQEQYWFNVGFDTTYEIVQNEKARERVENVIKSIKEKAKNKKDLGRYTYALFTGIQVINNEFENFPRQKAEGLSDFEDAFDAPIKLYNTIKTELGDWKYPSLTTWPKVYTYDYYQKTMPTMWGMPLFSYSNAKARHERDLDFSDHFKYHLYTKKEEIKKQAFERYLVERKFKEY